jgi:transposase-like protein
LCTRSCEPRGSASRCRPPCSASLPGGPREGAELREGLDDLFTVLDLGIRGRLRRFLQTTNAVENLFSSFRRLARNVKRWRSGSMVLRWVGAAAIDAAKKFRMVKGHEDLRQLADALKPKAGKEAKRA